jgi:hypothetical protein
MDKIQINRQFSKPQIAFMSSKARFKLWRASRRQGKTNAAEYEHGKFALTHPNTVNWYVAQDLALCKELNVPLFRELFPGELIKSYSQSERKYELFNNSPFYFKTANSSDSLRGRKIHKLTCEEPTYWQNGKDIYHNILRPQLADTKGSCSIIFTPPTAKAPRGSEWVRRLELDWAEQVKQGNPDYAIFHNTIWDSPFIDDDEKKILERSTDPETWTCEYLANYNDKSGTVYWEMDPLRDKRTITDRLLITVRGMDFGIADNTACSWIGLLNEKQVYIYEEYVANNLDVPSHAFAIKAKTTYPPQWTCLDSACWARDATLTSVSKRFAQEGIACTQGTKDLDGSVSDMKRMFAAGNIIIDPKCTNLLKAIDEWQHGQHEPDILAATRYGIDSLIRSGKLLPPMRPTHNTYQSLSARWDNEKKETAKIKALLDNPRRDLRFRIY